jgi:hypothetical protein
MAVSLQDRRRTDWKNILNCLPLKQRPEARCHANVRLMMDAFLKKCTEAASECRQVGAGDGAVETAKKTKH